MRASILAVAVAALICCTDAATGTLPLAITIGNADRKVGLRVVHQRLSMFMIMPTLVRITRRGSGHVEYTQAYIHADHSCPVQIDLSGQHVEITEKLSLTNTGREHLQSFIYCLPEQHVQRLSYLSVRCT